MIDGCLSVAGNCTELCETCRSSHEAYAARASGDRDLALRLQTEVYNLRFENGKLQEALAAVREERDFFEGRKPRLRWREAGNIHNLTSGTVAAAWMHDIGMAGKKPTWRVQILLTELRECMYIKGNLPKVKERVEKKVEEWFRRALS
jgi:hypothetical protein